MGRCGYPAEFRRQVLGLVEGGPRVGAPAVDLGVSEQTIYSWCRQDRVDKGRQPVVPSAGCSARAWPLKASPRARR